MQQNGQMDECGFLEDYKTWSDNTEYNYRIFAKHNEISNFVINYPILYEKVKNNEKIPFGGAFFRPRPVRQLQRHDCEDGDEPDRGPLRDDRHDR